jgi:hypothetical protein
MKIVLAALIAALFACPAYAAEPLCFTAATEKKLSGAAKSGFIKKCVRERCQANATEKKLAGAARNSFSAKCMAEGMEPYCSEQAERKKLAGAAKSSFMKKCQSAH